MINLPEPLKTRIAPSPTGHLHLGHALHIIYVLGIAKKLGATVAFRLEDHDRERCRPEFETSILEDLEWLGVPVPTELWRQSERSHVYQSHLEKLINSDLVYACRCSRKDIQASTGQEAGELTYPGTCRQKNYPLDHPDSAIRLKLDQKPISDSYAQEQLNPPFIDLLGDKTMGLPTQRVGDVVIKDRRGNWTYQFTVVIDDLEQGINLIIRGQDLLTSTVTQIAMRNLLAQHPPTPIFVHHPLILGEDGQKLAKRKSSEAISYMRRMGLSADDVKSLAAFAGGLIDTRRVVGDFSDLDFKLKH